MILTVCKKFTFEAAHRLPKHKGKCKNFHGHHYILEVTIGASLLNGDGMIIDFGDLKEIVNKNIIDIYDHQNLNDFWVTPTAEIMVRDIAIKLSLLFDKDNRRLEKLRLYETPDSYAEVIL